MNDMTYITVRDGKFRLVFPSSDTKKYIWITGLPDLDKLKQIRAKLLENAPHTEAELKTFRKKYKKPPPSYIVKNNKIKTKGIYSRKMG